MGGLHPYYLYECAVSAVTVAEGPYSAPIAVRTHEAGKYSVPPYRATWCDIGICEEGLRSRRIQGGLPPPISGSGPVSGAGVKVTKLHV